MDFVRATAATSFASDTGQRQDMSKVITFGNSYRVSTSAIIGAAVVLAVVLYVVKK